MAKQKKKINDEEITSANQRAARVLKDLQELYFSVVEPLETGFMFHDFHTSPLQAGDFYAKPSVLLIGQYSTGKTSFIKFVIGRDFPGQRIGPEPTTDRFMAIMHGDQERVVPGNAAAAQQNLPWTGLQKFGVEFLNRFECAETSAPVLQELTFIDSPGILSGEKQRLQRGYDFVKVCKWFAERADKILLLFDAHKLDISDEFKRTIEGISFAHNKISVVLNKADMISHQELMRVYGALMWSLGKVMQTPEVARVYVSSFWDQAKKDHIFVPLFERERHDLMSDLRQLPRSSTVSKINDMVKRCRILKVHICIVSYLREQMPAMFGKAKKMEELVENLDRVFVEVQRKHSLPVGDFPNLQDFKERLKGLDMSTFKTATPKKLARLDQLLSVDIPHLLDVVSQDIRTKLANPFDDAEDGLLDVVESDAEWGVPMATRKTAGEAFAALELNAEGRATGGAVKNALQQTGLDVKVLRQIWNLACIDGLGSLDKDEWIVAMHLVNVVKASKPLPPSLPLVLIPPTKRSSPMYAESSSN